MKLIIISGLSGSGKSVALHTLEDGGFYCIDNLPAALLGDLGRHIDQSGQSGDRYAIGIDARNEAAELARFPEVLESLKARGIDSEILFLQADVATLIKRFSETRRRHPLSGPGGASLEEAIRMEAELLAPILERADLVIDTTSTNVHQLRELVRERLDRRSGARLSLLFQSFGFKHGIPKDADFVFDIRCLPNPHWEPALRPFTGRDAPVQNFLNRQESVGRMYEQIVGFLEEWLPSFEREGRSYLTVAIGCTGGQHRSVYLAERMTAHFRAKGQTVSVRHRELQ